MVKSLRRSLALFTAAAVLMTFCTSGFTAVFAADNTITEPVVTCPFHGHDHSDIKFFTADEWAASSGEADTYRAALPGFNPRTDYQIVGTGDAALLDSGDVTLMMVEKDSVLGDGTNDTLTAEDFAKRIVALQQKPGTEEIPLRIPMAGMQKARPNTEYDIIVGGTDADPWKSRVRTNVINRTGSHGVGYTHIQKAVPEASKTEHEIHTQLATYAWEGTEVSIIENSFTFLAAESTGPAEGINNTALAAAGIEILDSGKYTVDEFGDATIKIKQMGTAAAGTYSYKVKLAYDYNDADYSGVESLAYGEGTGEDVVITFDIKEPTFISNVSINVMHDGDEPYPVPDVDGNDDLYLMFGLVPQGTEIEYGSDIEDLTGADEFGSVADIENSEDGKAVFNDGILADAQYDLYYYFHRNEDTNNGTQYAYKIASGLEVKDLRVCTNDDDTIDCDDPTGDDEEDHAVGCGRFGTHPVQPILDPADTNEGDGIDELTVNFINIDILDFIEDKAGFDALPEPTMLSDPKFTFEATYKHGDIYGDEGLDLLAAEPDMNQSEDMLNITVFAGGTLTITLDDELDLVNKSYAWGTVEGKFDRETPFEELEYTKTPVDSTTKTFTRANLQECMVVAFYADAVDRYDWDVDGDETAALGEITYNYTPADEASDMITVTNNGDENVNALSFSFGDESTKFTVEHYTDATGTQTTTAPTTIASGASIFFKILPAAGQSVKADEESGAAAPAAVEGTLTISGTGVVGDTVPNVTIDASYTVVPQVIDSVTFPTTVGLTYGMGLNAANAVLAGGAVLLADGAASTGEGSGGTWAYVDDSNPVLNVTNDGAEVVFTPNNTVNFDYSDVDDYDDNSGEGPVKITRTIDIAVAPKAITVTAVDQTKALGETDKTLTVTGTDGGNFVTVTAEYKDDGTDNDAENDAYTLIAGNEFSGNLAIASGDPAVGLVRAITLGEVKISRAGAPDAASNYAITFVPGTYTTGKATISSHTAPVAVSMNAKAAFDASITTQTELESYALTNYPTVSVATTDGAKEVNVASWAQTGGTFDQKGGAYTLTATLDTDDNVATDTYVTPITKSFTVTAVTTTAPAKSAAVSILQDDSRLNAAATKTAVTVTDLVAGGILSNAGSQTVEGETIAYEVEWSGTTTLDITSADGTKTGEYTGVLRYPAAPVWFTAPTHSGYTTTITVENKTMGYIEATLNNTIFTDGSSTVYRGQTAWDILDDTSIDVKDAASAGSTISGEPAKLKYSFSATDEGEFVTTTPEALEDAKAVAPVDAGEYQVEITLVSDTHIADPLIIPFEIAPYQLVWDLTGVTADNKIYNGTAATTTTGDVALAAITGITPAETGIVVNEQPTVTAAFGDANVDTGKTVTISVANNGSITYGSNKAANYAHPVATTADVTADITAASFTAVSVTISNLVRPGERYVGETLTATANSAVPEGPLTYVWSHVEDGGEPLTDNNAQTYVVKVSDLNKNLKVTVGTSNGNYSGTVASDGNYTIVDRPGRAVAKTGDDLVAAGNPTANAFTVMAGVNIPTGNDIAAQVVEYALSTTDQATDIVGSTWTEANATVSVDNDAVAFTALDPNKAYYVFARSKANATTGTVAGTPVLVSGAITTDKSAAPVLTAVTEDADAIVFDGSTIDLDDWFTAPTQTGEETYTVTYAIDESSTGEGTLGDGDGGGDNNILTITKVGTFVINAIIVEDGNEDRHAGAETNTLTVAEGIVRIATFTATLDDSDNPAKEKGITVSSTTDPEGVDVEYLLVSIQNPEELVGNEVWSTTAPTELPEYNTQYYLHARVKADASVDDNLWTTTGAVAATPVALKLGENYWLTDAGFVDRAVDAVTEAKTEGFAAVRALTEDAAKTAAEAYIDAIIKAVGVTTGTADVTAVVTTDTYTAAEDKVADPVNGSYKFDVALSAGEPDVDPEMLSVITQTVEDITFVLTAKVLPTVAADEDPEVTYAGTTIDTSAHFTITPVSGSGSVDVDSASISYALVDSTNDDPDETLTGVGTIDASTGVLTVTKAGTFEVWMNIVETAAHGPLSLGVDLTVNKGTAVIDGDPTVTMVKAGDRDTLGIAVNAVTDPASLAVQWQVSEDDDLDANALATGWSADPYPTTVADWNKTYYFYFRLNPTQAPSLSTDLYDISEAFAKVEYTIGDAPELTPAEWITAAKDAVEAVANSQEANYLFVTEGTEYTVETAKAYIEGLITQAFGGFATNNITFTVDTAAADGFLASVAETDTDADNVGNNNGVPGYYRFTITIGNSTLTPADDVTLPASGVYTLAIPYERFVPATPSELIAEAVALLADYTFETDATDLTTAELALAEVGDILDTLLADLINKGVTYEVAAIAVDPFEAPVEKELLTDGTEGFYKFTVTIGHEDDAEGTLDEVLPADDGASFTMVLPFATIEATPEAWVAAAAVALAEAKAQFVIEETEFADADAVAAYVKRLIDAELADYVTNGVVFTVNTDTYTPATDETSENNVGEGDGVEGTYTFTVTITHTEVTATIPVDDVFELDVPFKAFVPATPEELIADAAELVDVYNFTTTEKNVADADAAKLLVEAQLDTLLAELILMGVDYEVNAIADGAFEAATNETVALNDGEDGYYRFTVTITHEDDTEGDYETLLPETFGGSYELVLPYEMFDRTPEEWIAEVVAIVEAVADSTDEETYLFVTDETDLDEAGAKALIEGLVANLLSRYTENGVEVTVNTVAFTPSTPEASLNNAVVEGSGVEGSYTFTITVAHEDDTAGEFETVLPELDGGSYELVIPFEVFVPLTADELIAAAVKLVKADVFAGINLASNAVEDDAEAAVEAALDTLLADLIASGVEYEIADGAVFTESTPETEESDGVDGSYVFQITISSGEGTPVTLPDGGTFTVVVPYAPYVVGEPAEAIVAISVEDDDVTVIFDGIATGKLVVAAYDEVGKLVALEMVSLTNSGTAIVAFETGEVPTVEGSTIKAMLWSDDNNLVPAFAPLTATLEENEEEELEWTHPVIEVDDEDDEEEEEEEVVA